MKNTTNQIEYPYPYSEFDQPSGTFYICVVPATEIIKFFTVDRRKYTTGGKATGIQRRFSEKRIKEIADYVVSPDASFPTSIIMALNEEMYNIKPAERKLFVKEAEVIDGQHRILGLKKAYEKGAVDIIENFNLPVVFILEPTEEQKALLFATINGEQVRVTSSVVYDLFGVSDLYDPPKACHEVARALNFSKESPFYNRLKMLGRKSKPGTDESLSQGTFIKFLLPYISKSILEDRNALLKGKKPLPDPSLPLRSFYINKETQYIVRIMKNIFSAVKDVWPSEWDDPKNYILSKSTGYSGIMKGIEPILKYGKHRNSLKKDFFIKYFNEVKTYMQAHKLKFTSDKFRSGGAGENEIKKVLLTVYEDNY